MIEAGTDHQWARLVDRRSVDRGDLRRTALLEAFDDLLRQRPFASISVAQIASRAGLSAADFNVTFESTSMAAMALMAHLYDDSERAINLIISTDIRPEVRVRAALTILFDSAETSPHAFKAVVDARAIDPEIGALWDAGIHEFAIMVTGMIDRERSLGVAPQGIDSAALASTLIDLNNAAVERHVAAYAPKRDPHIDALTMLWVKAIYGSAYGDDA